MYELRTIPPELVPAIIDDVVGYLRNVLVYSPEYTLDDIVLAVIEERMVMLAIQDDTSTKGVVLLRPEVYPQRKYLQVVFLSGDGMKDWLDMVVDSLTAFGKDLGYDGLSTYGRVGWKRVLPQVDSERTYMISEFK